MNKMYMRVFLAIIFFVVIYPGNAGAEQTSPIKKTKPDKVGITPLGKLFITHPRSGDYFFQGEELLIEWSKQGYVPEICCRITLFKEQEKVTEITPKVCMNGYRWRIPDNLSGSAFKLRVTTIDGKVTAHSVSFPINVAKACLTVGEFKAIPERLREGETITIKARIDNTGGAKSDPTKVYVERGWLAEKWEVINGGELRRQDLSNVKTTEHPIPALPFGGHAYITLKVALTAGEWVFRTAVGWEPTQHWANIPAADKKTIRVSVYGDNLPDLVVCTYTTLYAIKNPPEHQPGIYAWIKAIVHNRGKLRALSTKGRIFVNNGGAFDFDIPPLWDKKFRIEKFVKLSEGAESDFYVEVDTGKTCSELNEANNIIHGKIKVKQPGENIPEIPMHCSDHLQLDSEP